MSDTLLPGYKKVPGSSRRYVTPSGQEISRRQYENIRFQKAGWHSWSEYQRVAKTPEYRRFVKAAETYEKTDRSWPRQKRKHWDFEEYLRRGSRGPSRTGYKNPDSEFNEAFLKAYRSDFDPSVGGPFEEFLIDIGLREPGMQFDIGDTP